MHFFHSIKMLIEQKVKNKEVTLVPSWLEEMGRQGPETWADTSQWCRLGRDCSIRM